MKAGMVLAVALVAATGCARTARTADKKVEDLLAHMRDAYKSVNSASYRTTSVFYGDAGNQTIKLDFDYKKPNMVRMIASIDDPSIKATSSVVTDGHTITFSPFNGQGSQSDYTSDALDKDILANLESISFWDWSQQLSTEPGKNMASSTFNVVSDETWNGKHWIVLEETAKKDNVFCRYFIDPKTYFIWRTDTKALDTKKDETDSQITSLTLNPVLRDSIFSGT